MRKHLTVLMCVTLCCLSLGLVACSCSKSSESSAPAEEAASASADKFYGTWKMAAMQSQGLVLVGDLSQMADVDIDMELTIAEGGGAKMSVDDETSNLTWKLIDDDTISIAAAKAEDESEGEETVLGDDDAVELTYQGGTLVMQMENEGKTVDVSFTPDGTLEGFSAITVASAVPITSADGLAGTWGLTGMNMLGVSMFGDTETLTSALSSSGESDYTLVLNEDGTGTLLGQPIEWKVTDTGAVLTSDGAEIALLDRNGELLVDMSGTISIEMCMLFGK